MHSSPYLANFYKISPTIVSPKKTHYNKFLIQMDNTCPERKASFPSRLAFSWFDSMAWKGYRSKLEMSDLWSVNSTESAKEIVPHFEKYCTDWLKKRKM